MEYDIGKWYANTDDTVWYVNHYGDIIQATIESRDVWKDDQENDPHFMKRYWITPSNIQWWELWWDEIRSWCYLHLTKQNKPWMPNNKWPGHSIELGDEIYLTEQEAIEAVALYLEKK